jgi:hypothetical protein
MANIDRVFEEFKNIIIVLRDSDKINDEDFKKIWLNKLAECQDVMNNLSEDDFNALDSRYNKWFSEYIKSIDI